MTILITGGSGFVGSHTAALARSKGHGVHVLDMRDPDDKTVAHDVLDVTTKDAQDRAAALRPDAIVHLAAHVDARASVMDPVTDFETNVLGTLRMLEAARACDATVVFSSSAAVYGDATSFPVTEDAAIRPASPYGASKASCETFINQYAKTYGLRTVILRYANVFGPAQGASDGEAAVVPAFIRAALDGRPLTIFGDGAQTRDFIHVADAACANLLALEYPNMQGIFNVSSGEEVQIARLAEAIRDICQSKSPIVHADAKGGDIRRSALDNSSIRKLMEIPSAPFDERIKEICVWYAHREGKEVMR